MAETAALNTYDYKCMGENWRSCQTLGFMSKDATSTLCVEVTVRCPWSIFVFLPHLLWRWLCLQLLGEWLILGYRPACSQMHFTVGGNSLRGCAFLFGVCPRCIQNNILQGQSSTHVHVCYFCQTMLVPHFSATGGVKKLLVGLN